MQRIIPRGNFKSVVADDYYDFLHFEQNAPMVSSLGVQRVFETFYTTGTPDSLTYNI
jgi:hypothetical protein